MRGNKRRATKSVNYKKKIKKIIGTSYYTYMCYIFKVCTMHKNSEKTHNYFVSLSVQLIINCPKKKRIHYLYMHKKCPVPLQIFHFRFAHFRFIYHTSTNRFKHLSMKYKATPSGSDNSNKKKYRFNDVPVLSHPIDHRHCLWRGVSGINSDYQL